MVGQFPNFSIIQISDKYQLESFCNKFESYSDFNFTSLIAWGVDRPAEACFLNKNLVIKIPDYLTGKPTYSILGKAKTDESVAKVLSLANELVFVPQPTVDSLKTPENFDIKDDRSNFDYIYLLSDLVSLSGKEHKLKRNKINRFKRDFPNHQFKTFDVSDKKSLDMCSKLFSKWTEETAGNQDELLAEGKALRQLMQNANELDLIGFELKIDNKSIGFSINEILDDGKYSICHFQKALHSFSHADTVLTRYSSKELMDKGCKYINWEQDLGVQGLRQLKESYRPAKYLKKYTVKLKK